MDVAQFINVLPLVTAAAYAILLTVLPARMVHRSRQTRWFFAVLGTSIFWELFLFFFTSSGQPNLPLTALVTNATILGVTTAVYVAGSPERRWLLLGGFTVLASVVLDLVMPQPLLPLGEDAAWQATAGGLLAVTAWSGLILSILILTWRDYRDTRLPWHANRLLHWVVFVVVTALGELMTLWSIPWLFAFGHLIRFLGVLGLAQAITSHRLFDVRAALRKALALMLVALFSAIPASVVLTVTLWLTSRFQLPLSQFYPIALVVIAAGFLLYQPFRRFLERIIYRYFVGQEFQTSHVVRRYSQAISRTLSVEQLSQVIIGTLSELLQTTRGALMLVSRTASGYEVEAIPALRQGARHSRDFAPNDPFIKTLTGDRRPLLQYDLDFNPYFQSLPEAERTWLAEQGMEVYVPIHDGDELAGLIALGPKRSGLAYRSNELELVQVLAEQTAIALQNARLYSELNRQNERIRSLNIDLRERNERLEILDRIKSDFITIASHELRTPLTQVKGYTDILETMNEDQPLTQEDASRIVGRISRASSRLETLLAAMLDASHLEIRGMDLTYTRTKMELILQSAIEPLAEAVEQRHLQLELHDVGQLPPIDADFERLVQAFHNVIGNAVKYTPDHGTITVSASLPQGADGGQEFIEVVVSDSGIGIDPQYHDLIFEKFFRIGSPELHSTGSTKFKGAGPGLGLHIARGVIEAHGGHIWVESEGEDEERLPGSRFHVILPHTRRRLNGEAESTSRARQGLPARLIR